jgi:predicted extracellular nuclease
MFKPIPSVLALAISASAQASDIAITGVIDATLSGGTPKAVELYVINDIADLSRCGIGSANNGGGTDNEEFTFPATAVTAGSYIYVASEDTQFNAFFGFTPDYTSSAANVNGDDAIELFCDGEVVDVFGDIETDGTGQPWEYLDGWAYRVAESGPDGSNFILANWLFSGPDALDGESSNATAGRPFPFGTFDGSQSSDTDNPPQVVSTQPSNGDVDVATNALIEVTFSEPAAVSAWESLSCSISGDIALGSATVDDTVFSLTPALEFVAGETCSLTIFANDVEDLDGDESNNLVEDVSFSFTVSESTVGAGDGPQAGDLILTGVVDGSLSGGLPKAIEIFVVNDIDDLSFCGVGSANNGGGTDGQELTFDAVSAEAGSYIYIATEDTQFTNFFGFSPDYISGSAAGLNGDDAVELFCNGEVVDVFGDINQDGTGTAWDYQDGWAARVAGTGPDGATFVLDSWTFSGTNALDNVDTNASAPTPFPVASFFVPEQLVISGVFDGPLSGGVPKFVEVYAVSNIDDLSVFGLGSANNGGGTDGEEFTFPAISISAGDYLYVASESEGFEAFFGFTPNFTSGVANINGDDAIELFKDGEVTDTFGDINVDGNGTPWEYLDGWAYRVSSTGPDGAAFILDNWTFSGPNALDGESANSTAEIPFPTATFSTDGTTGGNDGGDNGGDEGDGNTDTGLAVKISEIQGSGESSPLVNQLVTVEGIVVADFQNGEAGSNGNFDGFYLQEETIDFDADPLTSEGIFIFDGSGDIVDVQIGDKVTVTGTVAEFFEETQIGSVTNVSVVSSGNLGETELTAITLPTETTITNSDGDLLANLEPYEGMWVQFAQTLGVTEIFNLGRFGELGLIEGGRLFQFTQINTPDEAAFQAYLEDTAKRRVTLDDGFTVQNPQPIPFPSPGLSTSNYVRIGDETTNVEGVIRYSFGVYRVVPTITPSFTQFDRPERPDVGGSLSVVSYNVLNFFNTLDENGNTCFIGGGTGDCRGADNQVEFERQLDKLVTTLVELDADIIGLIEIENDYVDAQSAIAELIAAVNADPRARSCERYDFVDPGTRIGSDAIAVGLMYCADTVSVAEGTSVAILDDDGLPELGLEGLVPLFSGRGSNRAILATTFTELATQESLTIAVNHFKSKGSGCGPGDDDTTTGQGNCNLTRVQASQALHTWLATDPTGSNDEDFLIIGDLNAYAKEDPLVELEQNGFTNVISDPEAYSFVFDGQSGNLDHGLASASLLAQMTGAADWHINADESNALDYNTDFGTETRLEIFDGTVPFRSSDHDPLVIGFDLSSANEPVIGDFDGDGDVDINDIRALFAAISQGQDIDRSFDLNNDGTVNIFDVFALQSLCTRTACAPE